MNVESIEHTGLLKPIRVNDKFVERTGFYELICGEGRLLAHKKLGRAEVTAEIVTCTRKEAYLQSLVENIARTKPDSMDFARELKRLHDEGWDFQNIARIARKNETYIRAYIRLVEQGEERLIQGVESGVFPIKFATQVASTDDGQLQNVLMDAFDEGIVTTTNFAQARRIIAARSRDSKKSAANKRYTVTQLVQDRRWSRHTVLQAIHRRHESGLPLSRVWQEDTSLFEAAVRYFGSWEQALRAAGMQPSPRRRWSRDRVIRELQHWQRNSTESLRRADANLAAAAARLFGSLNAAMEAAHVVPKGRRWSKHKIIQAIQDRYVRGQSIERPGCGDQRLAVAAKRHFGNWSAALTAAGFTRTTTTSPRKTA